MANIYHGDDAPRGRMKDSGKTAEELDAARRRNTAYEYLCHLEEARKWLEACLESELPKASDLENALRNGVILGKLACFFAPDVIKPKHIYDADEAIYQDRGLVFRHTDNCSQWIKAMRKTKFPEIFYPEVTDLYDKKNMPRVIYCVHALSRFLYNLGIAPEMEDLHGVAQFTEEEISAMDKELERLGVQMPKFNKIGGLLAKEVGEDEALMHAAILAINQGLEKQIPAPDLLKLLKAGPAGLKKIDTTDNVPDRYRTLLIARRAEKLGSTSTVDDDVSQEDAQEEADIYDTNLTKAEIQQGINTVNAEVLAEKRAAALAAINAAIETGDPSTILAALQAEFADVSNVAEEAADDYKTALVALKQGRELTYPEVQQGVDQGNATLARRKEVEAALKDILSTLDLGDVNALLHKLKSFKDLLGLPDFDESNIARYLKALIARKGDGELSLEDLIAVINDVNAELEKERIFAEALAALNTAILGGDPETTLKCLQNPALGIQDVDPSGAFQYHFVLQEAVKSHSGALSREEVQEEINKANKEAEENAKHAASIFALNDAIRAGDSSRTLTCLKDPLTRIQFVQDKCEPRYQPALAEALKAKEEESGKSTTSWKKFTTDTGRVYYHNKETNTTQWTPPADMSDPNLTHPEAQEIVDKCNAQQSRQEMFESKDGVIIQLQALIRGLLVRKQFKDRLGFLKSQENVAIKLQAHTRGFLQKKKFRERLDYLNDQGDAAVKIQALWKGYKARKQYRNLTKVTAPPVATVRKFLHLLDQSDADFREELRLQKLKGKVILDIKANNQMEHDLNELDIKIGLLVKNRIELQDVVKHSKKLKKSRLRGGSREKLDPQGQSGLKSLNKDARDRLESYQHFFYLLQTHPTYLAKLVFVEKPLERWSQTKTKHFLEKIISTVYNYASNSREKYLLLKLYRTAMKEEIVHKVDRVKEFITGNPKIIQLVINHHRSSSESSYLAHTLGPLVERLLKLNDLDLNTDPVDIYKRWIGTQERESGQKSDLPYDVDKTQALKHPEVVKVVDETVVQLLNFASQFQAAIIESLPSFPYGMRFICSELAKDLREKFANVSDDEIIKVIGNILFSRFLSPAIIAPEGFEVIKKELGEQVSDIQRRNLANIARVLQVAASGQRFDGDSEHMTPLNKFIAEAWAKFKQFFVRATEVESSEAHFNIDEYSDVVMLSKPSIYMSAAEIFYTHEMIAKNVQEICPASDDPLREILSDLGDVGAEEEVLGEEGTPQFQANQAPMSLLLTNKFEVPEDDDTSIKALFVKTKRHVIDVIRFQEGKNLKTILETPATEEQEAAHLEFAAKRRIEETALREGGKAKEDIVSPTSPEKITSLEELKQQIVEAVGTLEKEGLCSSENNYQDLLNAVAQDIRNQRIYRRQRKQELSKLETTVSELENKKKFYSDAIEFYDQYIESCMGQMSKGPAKKKSGFHFRRRKEKNTDAEGHFFGSVKYSGTKLKEKGVLLSVDASENQLKGVTIEISCKEVGVFEIKATFMGMQMEKMELLFQDLLQLQYENVQKMKLLDYCTVNVNLLIYLLNKKFYGK
eukprot:m.46389 g.46389  ORF g.46389 m.46389 type:complete len:1559 (-) comp17519_c0_seq1:93-4769(-)